MTLGAGAVNGIYIAGVLKPGVFLGESGMSFLGL